MRARPASLAVLSALLATVYFFLPPSPTGVVNAVGSRECAAGTISSEGGAATNFGREKPADGARSAVNWTHLDSLVSFNGAEDHCPKVSSEGIARFLAKRGETPANLVTAFERAHNRVYLDRALALFPNSPIVLMAATGPSPNGATAKPGENYVPDAQRMAFIERFKAADPNNPLPWIFSAQELFKAGQTGDAIGAVRSALERPAFYAYTTEHWDATQQLYEESGLHPAEANLLAMVALALPHMTAAHQSSRSLEAWQKTAAESGDSAAAEEAQRLMYGLGRTFATPEASRTLIGQLVGISMEGKALKSLAADAQPAWLTSTGAQRLDELDAQKTRTQALIKAGGFEWLLQSHDDALLTEYLRRNRSDGELSALTWLEAQRAK